MAAGVPEAGCAAVSERSEVVAAAIGRSALPLIGTSSRTPRTHDGASPDQYLVAAQLGELAVQLRVAGRCLVHEALIRGLIDPAIQGHESISSQFDQLDLDEARPPSEQLEPGPSRTVRVAEGILTAGMDVERPGDDEHGVSFAPDASTRQARLAVAAHRSEDRTRAEPVTPTTRRSRLGGVGQRRRRLLASPEGRRPRPHTIRTRRRFKHGLPRTPMSSSRPQEPPFSRACRGR